MEVGKYGQKDKGAVYGRLKVAEVGYSQLRNCKRSLGKLRRPNLANRELPRTGCFE